MRAELTTLEQIDSYLAGDLSPAETAAFEAKMEADPGLKEKVNHQNDLLRAVNRKAMRAEINTVAASVAGGTTAGSGMSNLFIGITSVVTVGLATTGIIYLNSGKDTQQRNEPIANVQPISDNQDSAIYELNILNESQIDIEQPETIFSSINHYEEEPGDQMSVDVYFQPSADRAVTNSGTTSSVEREQDDYLAETNGMVEENNSDRPTVINHSARASFPGGNIALKEFIDRNLRYPKTAKNKGIGGVVKVEFHVDFLGKITEIDAKCIKMNGEDGVPFNEMRRLMNKKVENLFIGNATHVLRTMPAWVAAKDRDGNSILSVQHMYFKYDLNKGCSVYQLDE